MKSKFFHIEGHRSGKLVAWEFSHVDSGFVYWFCLCDCGGAHVVRADQLFAGNTTSCGCKAITNAGNSPIEHKKHGHWSGGRGTVEWSAWQQMIGRCENPNHQFFHRYGGRGIKVCKRWREDFRHFLADMGDRPSNKYSLDRKDNDGNYEPDNCRWATKKQQSRNQSNNVLVEFNGKKQTIAEWAEDLGMNYKTLHNRLRFRNWPVEKALVPLRR